LLCFAIEDISGESLVIKPVRPAVLILGDRFTVINCASFVLVLNTSAQELPDKTALAAWFVGPRRLFQHLITIALEWHSSSRPLFFIELLEKSGGFEFLH
jgi:hypothetical protein